MLTKRCFFCVLALIIGLSGGAGLVMTLRPSVPPVGWAPVQVPDVPGSVTWFAAGAYTTTDVDAVATWYAAALDSKPVWDWSDECRYDACFAITGTIGDLPVTMQGILSGTEVRVNVAGNVPQPRY